MPIQTPSTGRNVAGWLHLLLRWFYERLTRMDVPGPADLIFVLAGKMERKRYGLELYRAGFATRLILSIGRFEVSKMPKVQYSFASELVAERDRTAPEQRHFFCQIEGHNTRIYRPNLRRWSTYGEILGLREHLGREPVARIIVVSTDIHLRRVALVFEKVFRGSAVEFQYCPVPADQSSVSKSRWWARLDDRTYVISETVKLLAYRAILLTPEFVIRRCMRLE